MKKAIDERWEKWQAVKEAAAAIRPGTLKIRSNPVEGRSGHAFIGYNPADSQPLFLGFVNEHGGTNSINFPPSLLPELALVLDVFLSGNNADMVRVEEVA